MDTKTDHLETDPITVPGQNYALISIVSDQSNQKHDKCGVKIRGVFNTKEDAQHHAKKLQALDQTFDVFLVEMYKWLLVPPDISKIDEQHHADEILNNIVQTHKEEQVKAKQLYEERKDEVKKGKEDPIDSVNEK